MLAFAVGYRIGLAAVGLEPRAPSKYQSYYGLRPEAYRAYAKAYARRNPAAVAKRQKRWREERGGREWHIAWDRRDREALGDHYVKNKLRQIAPVPSALIPRNIIEAKKRHLKNVREDRDR